jgi:subtilisin family serine protease
MNSLNLLKFTLAALPAVAPATPVWAASDAERPVIARQADLPRHEYQVGQDSFRLISDEQLFRSFADQLVRDRIAVTQNYEFQDQRQLADYYRSIAIIYRSIPDFPSAMRYQAMADAINPGSTYSIGHAVFLAEASLAAQELGRDSPGYRELLAEGLKAQLGQVPFAAIRQDLIQWRSDNQVAGLAGVQAAAQGITDPKLKANGGKASGSLVSEILQWRTAYRSLYWLPLLGPIAKDMLAANAALVSQSDRWTPTTVALDAEAKLTPVTIGVWDTGVDPAVFPGQMWRNRRERPNGRDDDRNGHIDDLHGIAFSAGGKPISGTLRDLGPLSGRRDMLIQLAVGQQELGLGEDTEAVIAFEAAFRGAAPKERAQLSSDINKVTNFLHGTHVASIAVSGNPFARILTIGNDFPDLEDDKTPSSVAKATQLGKATLETVAYMRKAGVRVVNMSWYVSPATIEAELEADGVGESAQDRATLARAIFAEHRLWLERAISSAPEILFVCGAGNTADDVDFGDFAPAGLRLSNLITIGAVDALDRVTDFSSAGGNVWLYANGAGVNGSLPGGRQGRFSGTSAAAPQVTNLAAKLLALNPSLTPSELIATMRATGRPVEGNGEALIINPKVAIEVVRDDIVAAGKT